MASWAIDFDWRVLFGRRSLPTFRGYHTVRTTSVRPRRAWTAKWALGTRVCTVHCPENHRLQCCWWQKLYGCASSAAQIRSCPAYRRQDVRSRWQIRYADCGPPCVFLKITPILWIVWLSKFITTFEVRETTHYLATLVYLLNIRCGLRDLGLWPFSYASSRCCVWYFRWHSITLSLNGEYCSKASWGLVSKYVK